MTAKRGPGRPPLREGEETRVVLVRVPAGDHELLTDEAHRAGVSLAEYLRAPAVAKARRARAQRAAKG